MILAESDYRIEPAKVIYLEMHDDPQFILPAKPGVLLYKLDKPIDADKYRYYYKSVGFLWNWLDRLAINDEELSAKINAENISIYVLSQNNTDAGYAEFAVEKDYVEIVYFGLFPGF